MAKDYTSTLNLPQTDFSMRANLPQREPETIKYWNEIDLYNKMVDARADGERFTLHDGPPFSNGNIHMGHALNKVLKDFINKYKAMAGYKIDYVPGWDNHGLPIERAIENSKKKLNKEMTVPEFRRACEDFAEDFIQKQMAGFKRLGIVGDWEHPYRTMDRHFEGQEVKIFGAMYDKGYIYKGLKPVTWCPFCATAVAEADIEYKDDACTSVYVKFPMHDDLGKLSEYDLSKMFFVIWTTTIWTLPGNMGICLHPRDSYALVKADNGEIYIMAEALTEKTMKMGGFENYEILATYPGAFFERMLAKHPFLDKTSLLVNAEYVTMDSGTGCVHTAPGFGADDYQTGMRYGLDLIVPVDDYGRHTEYAGKYAGMKTEESNPIIKADMAESGMLFASEEIMHSYPHHDRCKKPVIFRATPQWFCSVESFKDQAIKAIENVEWFPAWGGDRMESMIRERSDWCISRQRRWGLPIPVFYCCDCEKPVSTPASIEKISKLFDEFGSNIWFEKEAMELIPEGMTCPHCGGKTFTKEKDTLDCWFDSGSTHYACLMHRTPDRWPADVYLEGADQYRGWFQSSLLTSVGALDRGAPFKQVLTHGWVVDGEGRAMHKSLGNGVDPDEIVKKYGSDILRLWAASSDYHADVRCSENIFKQLSEVYRKIRNTARIMMANLGDFNPDTDIVAFNDMLEIDQWIMAETNKLVKQCLEAYDEYEFHIVYNAINKFCTIELSKLYIDITKDRLYVEKADSAARRSGQSALYAVLQVITRLLAPVISFTAEEIWKAMPHASEDKCESVFLNDMPKYNEELATATEALCAKWDKLFEYRDDVMKALEIARANKMIGKSLDAKVTVYTNDDEAYAALSAFADKLAETYITSAAYVLKSDAPEGAFNETQTGIAVVVEPADGHKCDRCWSYSTEGKQTEDGFICARCLSIIE